MEVAKDEPLYILSLPMGKEGHQDSRTNRQGLQLSAHAPHVDVLLHSSS
jgi:hypothetical protein